MPPESGQLRVLESCRTASKSKSACVGNGPWDCASAIGLGRGGAGGAPAATGEQLPEPDGAVMTGRGCREAVGGEHHVHDTWPVCPSKL